MDSQKNNVYFKHPLIFAIALGLAGIIALPLAVKLNWNWIPTDVMIFMDQNGLGNIYLSLMPFICAVIYFALLKFKRIDHSLTYKMYILVIFLSLFNLIFGSTGALIFAVICIPFDLIWNKPNGRL